MLADRFGGGPEKWAVMPADRREYWLGLLGVEGKVASAYDGLESGDQVVFDEDEEW